MAKNQVVVTLSVRDEITSQLRGITGNLRGQISGFGSEVNMATNSVRGLVMGIAAIGSGLVAAIGLAKGLKQAISAEMQDISSANNLMFTMKLDATQADKTIKDLNTRLSVKAAVLPGDNKDYIGAAGQLTAVMGKLAKNPEDFTEKTTKAAITTVLLATGARADAAMGASAVNRFIGGSSGLGELKMIDIFQKNPIFMDQLTANMKLAGLDPKKAGSGTAEQRLAIYQKTSDQIFTPAAITRLASTTEGKMQGILSQIFDDRTGLFGWMRELKDLSSNKATTALKSFQGFLDQIQNFMGNLSGGFDPMRAVSDMFLIFAKTTQDVTAILKKGSMVWNDLTYLFTKKVSDSLTDLSATIGRIDWRSIGFNFGDSLGKILTDVKLGKALEDSITASLNALSTTIGSAIKAATKDLFNFGTKNDPKTGNSINAKTGESLKLGDGSIGRYIAPLGKPKRDFVEDLTNFGKDRLGIPHSSLPSLGGSGSKGQQVAYNTFNVNGTNLTGKEIAIALNAEYGGYMNRIMA